MPGVKCRRGVAMQVGTWGHGSVQVGEKTGSRLGPVRCCWPGLVRCYWSGLVLVLAWACALLLVWACALLLVWVCAGVVLGLVGQKGEGLKGLARSN